MANAAWAAARKMTSWSIRQRPRGGTRSFTCSHEVELWLIDLVSRNGTYCNEQRVVRPLHLHDGDRITIGGLTYTFRQPALAKRCGEDSVNDYERSRSTGDATVLDLRQQHVWLLIADIEKFTVLSREWEVDRLALSVGRWLRESLRIVEKHQGRVPKYLGDGFLACWDDRGDIRTEIIATIGEFQHLQKESAVSFRVALHYGLVTFGEQSASGEESMLGPEMNFIFRLEDLASQLEIKFCLSASAQKQLATLVATDAVPGEHRPGQEHANTHRCYVLAPPV